jgi:flagellar hook-length control protein FliK
VHTTPISGAAVALKASSAPSANSSLADLLLADASGNAGLDFRAIAATLFGVAGSTGGQTIASAKDSNTTKKPVASAPMKDSEDSKDKALSDPASTLAMHPELTAPIVVPEAVVPGSPKRGDLEAEERVKAASVPEAATSLTGAAALTTRMQIKSDEIADKLAESDSSNATALPAQNALLEVGQAKTKLPVSGAADLLNKMSPVENTLPQDRKSAAEGATASVIGVSGKKTSESTKALGNRTPAFGIAAPVKHDSTSAPNVKTPAAPLDTVAQTAADSRSVAPPVNPISNTSAKEIAESHMATKAASQAKALNPTLVAESRNAAEHSSAGDLGKLKDRSSAGGRDRIGKDRGKDARSGSTDSGKLASTQAGRVVPGTTNFGDNGSKDSGMGSPHNLAAQVRPGLTKPPTGISSAPTSIAEMDGPDEAVPLTISSPISAKFVQGMSGSEFRVGMQSQEFGSIDIRTSVARHMFSAQISVEHSDVAKSLATELPSLYSKLADQHVPVANIVIQGQSLASSSGFAQDAQQQQGWRPQQSHGVASLNADTILPAAAEALDSQGRLDIRI